MSKYWESEAQTRRKWIDPKLKVQGWEVDSEAILRMFKVLTSNLVYLTGGL